MLILIFLYIVLQNGAECEVEVVSDEGFENARHILGTWHLFKCPVPSRSVKKAEDMEQRS